MTDELRPNVGLSGRTALVTGSSRGLGAATAKRLGAMGADVVVTFRKREDEGAAVAESIRGMGRWSAHRHLEMSDMDSIEALFDWIESEEGPGGIDILVANAAATSLRPLLDQKPHNVRKTLDICVTGFLRAVQRSVPLMEARGGGRIVAVSGIDTVSWAPAHGLLAAAKAAMESMVQYLTVELGERNITTVGVNPDVFFGDSAQMMMGDFYDEAMRLVARTHPLRVAATPDDIAEVVALCCTDAARWFAGNTVMADAGSSFASRGIMVAQGMEIATMKGRLDSGADRGTSVPEL